MISLELSGYAHGSPSCNSRILYSSCLLFILPSDEEDEDEECRDAPPDDEEPSDDPIGEDGVDSLDGGSQGER